LTITLAFLGRFLPREAAILARSWGRNSVCLFVRHTRALWPKDRKYWRYADTAWKVNHSSFLTSKGVGERCPLCVTNPFEKRRLRGIFACNVWTVRVRTLPLLPKGWLKTNLSFLWITSKKNKLCYKVSLCDDFEQNYSLYVMVYRC